MEMKVFYFEPLGNEEPPREEGKPDGTGRWACRCPTCHSARLEMLIDEVKGIGRCWRCGKDRKLRQPVKKEDHPKNEEHLSGIKEAVKSEGLKAKPKTSQDTVSPDQLKFFRSLFAGRTDAYGMETATGPTSIRKPVVDSVFLDHLKGRNRIGVYLISNQNQVSYGVIDLDEPDEDKARKIYLSCLENNLYPHAERSKGKGFHIYVFLDTPVKAREMRKALCQITKEAGVSCEVFPKQDSVNANGGLGNYVYLPLFGKSVKVNRTVFLDTGFKPYEDQWGYLKKIRRSKAENIISLSEKCEEKPKDEAQDSGSQSDSSLDVEKYLTHYKIPFRIKKEPNRTFYLLPQCLFADSHTTTDNAGDSSIIQSLSGKITYQCFHGHCKNRTWRDAREKISGNNSLVEFCRGLIPHKSGRNLTEDIRSWVGNAFGKFTTEQIYRDLSISSVKEKSHVRVELLRMVQKGLLDRGTVAGSFLKLESVTNALEIKKDTPFPLAISLPGNLDRMVSIYKKNLIVGAGSSNGGKTAYALNCAYENRDKFEVVYFTTEMDSDELTLRIHNFGYSLKEWEKISFRPWESFHSIKPDALNILDYLEVQNGEFWKVGDDLRKIYEKLSTGVALVFIQMNRGAKFGWGGEKTIDRARLYFTIDDNKLTIEKGKLWNGQTNPNGKILPFKLHMGSRFEWGAPYDR